MIHKHKWLLLFGGLVLLVIALLLFLGSKARYVGGGVIGSNPELIPKDKLPLCEFTGARFVKEPCYSPPGATYE